MDATKQAEAQSRILFYLAKAIRIYLRSTTKLDPQERERLAEKAALAAIHSLDGIPEGMRK